MVSLAPQECSSLHFRGLNTPRSKLSEITSKTFLPVARTRSLAMCGYPSHSVSDRVTFSFITDHSTKVHFSARTCKRLPDSSMDRGPP